MTCSRCVHDVSTRTNERASQSRCLFRIGTASCHVTLHRRYPREVRETVRQPLSRDRDADFQRRSRRGSVALNNFPRENRDRRSARRSDRHVTLRDAPKVKGSQHDLVGMWSLPRIPGHIRLVYARGERSRTRSSRNARHVTLRNHGTRARHVRRPSRARRMAL